MGGPKRAIKGFIDKLDRLQLEGKMFAVFDTYMEGRFPKSPKVKADGGLFYFFL
ncbi:MAG: hypothetical protein QXU47_01870 [Candidatus Bathyarchaeia archaeon]